MWECGWGVWYDFWDVKCARNGLNTGFYRNENRNFSVSGGQNLTISVIGSTIQVFGFWWGVLNVNTPPTLFFISIICKCSAVRLAVLENVVNKRYYNVRVTYICKSVHEKSRCIIWFFGEASRLMQQLSFWIVPEFSWISAVQVTSIS